MTRGTAASDPAQDRFRVAIAGAGFSGAILARQLRQSGIDVVCFEKTAEVTVKDHWTQPVTGAGLNLNANALATLKQLDPELEEALRGIGLPRRCVRASTVTGRELYEIDIVEEGLADVYGLRVRWDDANTLIRQAAGDCIRWETTVEDYVTSLDGKIILNCLHANGTTSTEGDFDLLIAADGRYSKVRARALGEAKATFGDMCNFRLLVPNTQVDGTAWPEDKALFDDLQLIYNESPTLDNLDPDSVLRGDSAFVSTALRSSPRVGIMRIPKSKFNHDVGESLYIFGNFAIPEGEKMPSTWTSSEALRCLFTPAEGGSSLTPGGIFIRETLVKNARLLHWARFQAIPVTYSSGSDRVLLLGDAAHAFCPALGQGATSSIEDACVAAVVLRQTWMECGQQREAMSDAILAAVAEIDKRQADRAQFLGDSSAEAGHHMHFHEGETSGRSALEEDAAAWTCDHHGSGWRVKVRQMWNDYPKLGCDLK